MVEIQSVAAEIRRGKKKKDRNHRMKIYMVSLLHRATINQLNVGGQAEPITSTCQHTWHRCCYRPDALHVIQPTVSNHCPHYCYYYYCYYYYYYYYHYYYYYYYNRFTALCPGLPG